MALGSRIMRSLALAYRVPLLGGVTFVGVTGSTGKTTTKDLIHAILSSRLPGWKSEGNDNIVVYRTIFGTSPWHAYCVQEIAAAIGGKRIALERPLSLVRPRIGVVTNIGTDHLSAFGSVEEIAAEKGKLVAALPEAGTAILNADDPNVLAMGSRCRGRIVTYGLALGATIRAENVSCHWPDRLSFDVLYDGQREIVRTQLCGTHWVHCVLAAIGVALEMGIPLAAAARSVETVEPSERRMEPVTRPDGVTFIRDDVKAPLWSLRPAFEFMGSASASRKIIVLGTISDYARGSYQAYRDVAKQALEVADLVLFVGPKASKSQRAKTHPKGDALRHLTKGG
jgi:UDP-N-acetylmuramyl pentapeptide synthase